MEPVLRHPETDAEVTRCGELLVRSFGFPREDFERFNSELDRDRALAVFVGDEVAAFSRIRPFGQFWGGRRVPMGGHSPVGAAPEFRGRGFGSMVTAGHFADLRERGEVIAGLFPATTALYRGTGFGLAGTWVSHKVPARSLQTLRPPAGVTVRRGSIDDAPAVKEAYRRDAPRHPGHLDRPDVWWDTRLLRDLDKDLYLYVVDADSGPGELAGYVLYKQTPRHDWGYRISVVDMVAPDVDVAIVLWRLIGSSSTMTDDVHLVGSSEDALLLLLPEQDLSPLGGLRFMVRLVDMPGAFAARGYVPGVRAVAEFEVEDRHCPWNTGKWRLVVDDGAGRLEPGGSGAIRVSPPGLATLFSGYASAWTLAATGQLPGAAERDLADLAAAFASPTPWMPEIF
jgi:predicted acetyltransferase